MSDVPATAIDFINEGDLINVDTGEWGSVTCQVMEIHEGHGEWQMSLKVV